MACGLILFFSGSVSVDPDIFPLMRGTLTSLQTLVFAIVFAVIHSGCTSDPRAYPYVLEQEEFLFSPNYGIDVDGDGRDEFVNTGKEGTLSTVAMFLADRMSIDQVNFNEEVVSRPSVVDFEGDGREEILIPIVRNDSLFLVELESDLKNRKLEKKRELFIATGSGEQREGTWHPWRARVINTYVLLQDQDTSQLIVVMATTFARTPRGIVELSGPAFQDRRTFFVGANVRSHSPPEDLNGDGSPDLMLTAFASNNGADEGGFSDSLAYYIAVDLKEMSVQWSEPAWRKEKSTKATKLSNFTGPGGEREIATVAVRATHSASVQFRNPTDGVVNMEYVHPVGLSQIGVLPTTANTELLVLLDQNGKLCTYSRVSSQVRTIYNEGILTMKVGPDLDHDGRQDVYAFTENGVLIANGSGRKLANTPIRGSSHFSNVTSFNVGISSPDHVLFRGSQVTARYSIHPNPWYLFFRYWPVLPVLAGVGILFLPVKLSSTVLQLRQRAKAVEEKVGEQEKKIELMSTTISRLQEQVVDVLLPKPESSFPMQIKSVLDKYALDSSFDVEKFGGKLGYSTRQTIRKVKAATGKSPNEVIWLYRIENAKTLLRKGGMTIAEIADASGFKSQAHFSTKFRELEGVKPSEWK